MLLLFQHKEKEIGAAKGNPQVFSKAKAGAQAAGPSRPLTPVTEAPPVATAPSTRGPVPANTRNCRAFTSLARASLLSSQGLCPQAQWPERLGSQAAPLVCAGVTSGDSTGVMGPRRRGSSQLTGHRPPCTCKGRGHAAPHSAPGSLGSKTGAGSVVGGSGRARPPSGTAASLPPLPTRRPSPDPRPVCPEYTLSLALCKLPPSPCGSGDTSLTEITQVAAWEPACRRRASGSPQVPLPEKR